MCTATHMRPAGDEPQRTTLDAFLSNLSPTSAALQCELPPFMDASHSIDMELIGLGSNSVVFKCHDATGATFAVKGPRSPKARTASLSPQGRKDAAMLEELRHKHVVEHRESCADGSMIMEFLDGGSLLDVMERSGGKLGEVEASRLTAQILSGVAYLHSQGIIHRDIKPANIFYSSETATAKVGDIAVAAEASATKRCGVIVPVGTPAFLAPEVVRSGAHQQGSDVWAVGCSLVQLLSGRVPWDEEDSSFSAMFKIGNGVHPQLPEGLSEEATSFLKACFAPVEQRPSAEALLAHPFLAELPPTGPM